MRAVVISAGNLEVLERPAPEPAARDVIVTVHAAGLNAADLLQRQGFYPAPAGWPADVPGMELAGVVSAVGSDVDQPLLGRRVCALVGGGAQAAHCAVPAEHLLFVPDGVSWLEAGGFAEAFCTAHDALVSQAHLAASERVLISGAAGGVGLAAVQISHALGAHVIAVTRTSEHHQRLASMGANETITTDEVAALEPVDVVLELVGAANLALAQTVLARFARVVVIGVGGGGARVELDLLALMGRRASLTGSTLRSRSRAEKARVIARVGEEMVPLWTSGQLSMPIDRSFELAEVDEAYAWFAKPGKFGKVVLRVDD